MENRIWRGDTDMPDIRNDWKSATETQVLENTYWISEYLILLLNLSNNHGDLQKNAHRDQMQ